MIVVQDQVTILQEVVNHSVVAIEEVKPFVVVNAEIASDVAIERQVANLVSVGIPGPQGQRGEIGPASSDVIEKIASVALGGHRVVIADGSTGVNYADSSNIAHLDFVLGITTGAASAGAPVNVQVGNEMTEPSWNWTPGAVWLGLNGLMTQTPPTTGFVCRVGTALTASKLLIEIGEPITR